MKKKLTVLISIFVICVGLLYLNYKSCHPLFSEVNKDGGCDAFVLDDTKISYGKGNQQKTLYEGEEILVKWGYLGQYIFIIRDDFGKQVPAWIPKNKIRIK